MNDLMKDPAIYDGQWKFQVRYAAGKVLNVGCNNDGGRFGERGAINIDLVSKDEHTGFKIPAHVLADARSLPFKPGTFDTVVLGEILEHMQTADAITALKQAKSVLKCDGRLVATIPHDDRPIAEQGYGAFLETEYYPGIARCHYREITRVEFFEWLRKAGLKLTLWAQIKHVWGKMGTGVVATC